MIKQTRWKKLTQSMQLIPLLFASMLVGCASPYIPAHPNLKVECVGGECDEFFGVKTLKVVGSPLKYTGQFFGAEFGVNEFDIEYKDKKFKAVFDSRRMVEGARFYVVGQQVVAYFNGTWNEEYDPFYDFSYQSPSEGTYVFEGGGKLTGTFIYVPTMKEWREMGYKTSPWPMANVGFIGQYHDTNGQVRDVTLLSENFVLNGSAFIMVEGYDIAGALKPTTKKHLREVFEQYNQEIAWFNASNDSSVDASDFLSIAGAAAATAYGVNSGLSTDSAAALGAGTYQLIETGDASRLNAATNNLQSETTPEHKSQGQAAPSVEMSKEPNQASQQFADEVAIARLQASIATMKKLGKDSSMMESMLNEEFTKPRKPGSTISVRNNLLDGQEFGFCKDKDIDIQISSFCSAADSYYLNYTQTIGTKDEDEAYEQHRKSAKLALKVYKRLK